MLGAITGDIIGAPYEHRYWSAQPGFELFGPGAKPTDDTVLTIAVAEHCLAPELDLEEALRRAYHRAPTVGFSKMFKRWVQGTLTEPYRSFGNGSAMRVSPIAWTHDTLDDVVAAARLSALPTHGHPEGIRGAEVIAGAIFLARTGSSRDDIRVLGAARVHLGDRPGADQETGGVPDMSGDGACGAGLILGDGQLRGSHSACRSHRRRHRHPRRDHRQRGRGVLRGRAGGAHRRGLAPPQAVDALHRGGVLCSVHAISGSVPVMLDPIRHPHEPDVLFDTDLAPGR